MGNIKWDCYLVAITIGIIVAVLICPKYNSKFSEYSEKYWLVVVAIVISVSLLLCGWLTRYR